MKNIILIGLSGSGKSTLGKRLAEEFRLPFVDLDEQVAQAAGLSVQQIFSGYGEPFFRELESHTLSHVLAETGRVVATGGGAVLREDNLVALRSNGFVIFLDRPVEQIEQDIEFAGRPLLAGGAAQLREMAQQRRRRYLEAADVVLRNDGDEQQALEALVAACTPIVQAGYAVIGSPISHSLSPVIHSALFGPQGVTDHYFTVHVPRGRVPEYVAGVRAGLIKGFTVTIPHKQDIIPLLDEVEEDARICGAVNTVVRRGERLVGYNTDMGGFNLSLQRAGYSFSGRRVLLLGTGGAARAAALKAVWEGARELCILGRTVRKAEELAAQVAEQASVPVHSGTMDADHLCAEAARSDLLINSTSLGMSSVQDDFEDLSFLEKMPSGSVICDMVYNPPRTSLLRRAEELGLGVVGGLGMLIYQAILAQEHFFERRLDHEQLYSVAEAALQQREEMNK